MLIVMFIIGILISLAAISFNSSKKSAQFKTAAGAAAAYSGAIEAYMADNGQTPPGLGSAAWPTAVNGPVDAMVVAPGGGPKPYLSKIPEAVNDGVVSIGTGTAATGGSRAMITYRVVGRTYELLVNMSPADPARRCAITNGATMPAGYTRCG